MPARGIGSIITRGRRAFAIVERKRQPRGAAQNRITDSDPHSV